VGFVGVLLGVAGYCVVVGCWALLLGGFGNGFGGVCLVGWG